MSPWVVFAAAGGASWLLRIALIDLLPARKLPARVRTALESGGPAAMAALLTSEFVHIGADVEGLSAAVLGTVAAALATYRFGNLALTAVVGIAVYMLTALIV